LGIRIVVQQSSSWLMIVVEGCKDAGIDMRETCSNRVSVCLAARICNPT